MDPSRLNDAVAARVVAWHNRNPLARRIGAAQVHSVGHVLLPFAAPAQAVQAEAPGATASLRERALARARQGDTALPPAPRLSVAGGMPGGALANFEEDFIPPLSPRRVARWARRHGQPQLAARPNTTPLREVRALPLPAGMQPLPVLVLTAAIEIGHSRRRVLLGAGESAAVLGRRIPSALRTGLLGLLLAAVVALPMLPRQAAVDLLAAHLPAASAGVAALAAAPASVASAPALELPRSAQAVEAAASQPPADMPWLAVPAAAEPAASTPLGAPVVAHVAAPPGIDPAAATTGVVDVEPRLGKIELPSLGLPRERAGKTTAREGGPGGPGAATLPAEAAAGGAGASTSAATGPAPAMTGGPSAPAVAIAPAAAAASAPAPKPAMELGGTATFAVSSRLLRTRAEADQVRDAMQALLGIRGNGADGPAQAGQNPAVLIEVLPQGDDFRVVGWPYGQRAQAEKARAVLVSRGMRVEVVAF